MSDEGKILKVLSGGLFFGSLVFRDQEQVPAGKSEDRAIFVGAGRLFTVAGLNLMPQPRVFMQYRLDFQQMSPMIIARSTPFAMS